MTMIRTVDAIGFLRVPGAQVAGYRPEQARVTESDTGM
jgi:hypothetical protein